MKRIINAIIIMLMAFVCLSGCGQQYYSGTDDTGFKHFPDNKISPEQAIEIAKPYLDASYVLRTKNRDSELNMPEKKPITYVILYKNYYYVTKDNYDAKSVNFYLDYAVKVDKNTGGLIAPKDNVD